MMPRLADFNLALAVFVALLPGASAAFSQTAQPDGKGAAQQPEQPRPKVFFPMAEQPEMEMIDRIGALDLFRTEPAILPALDHGEQQPRGPAPLVDVLGCEDLL